VTAELVHSSRTGPVHTLTLDSPENRNALSSLLLDQLATGLTAVVTDDAARALVLTATGSVFCSGADLAAARAAAGPPAAGPPAAGPPAAGPPPTAPPTAAPPPTAPPTAGPPGPGRLPEILTLLRQARLPVIARVNGHTRAGGIGLIAACDLAVAVAGSTFAFSEVRVGVAPAMIMVPVLEVVDRRFLARAVLTGETFSAEEAAHAGLLTAVVADEAALDTWVHDAVASILRSAPGAVSATKALLRNLPAMSWAAGLDEARDRSARLFAGDEAAEGMDAFLHKRAPSWDVTTPWDATTPSDVAAPSDTTDS
jgi:methylglutaconyl-CoA hydratase